jgi:hypothetical protein
VNADGTLVHLRSRYDETHALKANVVTMNTRLLVDITISV